jgi:predicted ribosome quality control (RQC) complex YloA/Tae2 family protein
MDERDNVINIDHTINDGLKRKLDSSLDELGFPCKKVALSPGKPATPDSQSTPTAPNSAVQKLSKAERETQKTEKAKERELERLKKEQEKLKREEERRKKEEEKQKREQEREEEKQKREEERLKKVFLCGIGLIGSKRKKMS